ncbi:hypothetical protein [Marinospirillum perlucidum]|uniref:hypothetical protein n=1 Tax=Marinospirillum perlucidum TaxID=1982602 RepID=UPI001C498FF8|nr:hypothetical protein [Marinospirillum perlucidum]
MAGLLVVLLKALAASLLLVVAEIANGNLRVRILNRRLGKRRAKVWSLLLGCLLILVICVLTLPWINPQTRLESLAVGSSWLLVLLALDLYFGRYVFRFSWQRIGEDFNPLKGGYLSLGMLWVLLCPLLVFSWG